MTKTDCKLVFYYFATVNLFLGSERKKKKEVHQSVAVARAHVRHQEEELE